MCGIFFCCCLLHKTQATTKHVNSNNENETITITITNETFHCQSCYPTCVLEVLESGVVDIGHGASPPLASTIVSFKCLK